MPAGDFFTWQKQGNGMVNPLKLREMISLASFEKGRGRVSMDICRYYKSDYVALQMIRTFFMTTVALVIAGGLFIAGNLEWVLDRLVFIDFRILGGQILIGYLCILAVYLLITFLLARYRYRKAKRDMQDYLLHLTDLSELTEYPYDEEMWEKDR